ncbi:MAG TPA: LysR family transcriptional regulator, partial [Polyangiaceae bacterium]|nr:LysR family transcriptional regulator [Polyangiaceae bacterium]
MAFSSGAEHGPVGAPAQAATFDRCDSSWLSSGLSFVHGMPRVHDLSLRQLEYIVAVADTLGFHKAAASCHVSQPTLSAQVQLLEGVLGVRLFERDRRRVLVTPAGSELVARARRVLLETEDLIAAATRSQTPFAGTLRVGVIPTLAPYLLPEVTPAITERYPGLALVYREEKTADIV